jgi:hypothetical protein
MDEAALRTAGFDADAPAAGLKAAFARAVAFSSLSRFNFVIDHPNQLSATFCQRSMG